MAVLLFVWLMSNVPVVAIPQAGYDDALFVRLAKNLLTGQWLGPYDNLTLAKGPFFSGWIALGWIAGLPILVSEGLAYGLSCWLLIRGLRPWLRSEAVAFAIFLVILFNPMTYSVGQLRIMREGIYVPLTLLIFALVVWWFRCRNRSPALRAGLAAALGAVIGMFWCTREEGVWILPTLAACFAVMALLRLSEHAGPIGRRLRAALRPLGREAGLAGLAIAMAALFIGGVGWINQRHYGVSDIVEYKQREFLSAYGALSRVRHQQAWKPYVVIPREVLERVSAVSPAAAELRPYFDGTLPRDFAAVGCATYAIEPCDGEIRAGWFMWAFRDAVAHAGHYRSAPEARDFYRRLSAEIDAACNDGRLNCLPPRATMVPPFRNDYLMSTVRAAGSIVNLLAFLHTSGLPHEAMSCGIDDCGQTPWRAQFLDLVQTSLFVHAPWLPEPGFHSRSAEGSKLASLQRAELVARGLDKVASAYQTVFPWLLGFAVMTYVAAAFMVLRSRGVEPLFVVAGVCALLVASRIGLLSYLEVVAIPSINSLYLSPVYPPLLLFTVMAPLALFRQLRGLTAGAQGGEADLLPASPRH